jgi:hypothetical protein
MVMGGITCNKHHAKTREIEWLMVSSEVVDIDQNQNFYSGWHN